MPKNCQPVELRDVVKFFVEEIDGMGIHSGPLRNLGTPQSLEQCKKWELCNLIEDEFMHLVVPDGTGTLIQDKSLSTMAGSSKATTLSWVKKLEKGQSILPLVVRSKLHTDPYDSSFYIEDGAHRAIAYKIHVEKSRYIPIQAYIGER